MDDRLPVFVYGTLRVGEYNHGLVADRIVTAQPGVLAGHGLYATGLPYAVPAPGHQLHGDLLQLRPEDYAAAVQDLDQLEGYWPGRPERHCHYVRTRCLVEAGNALRPAWVYLAGPTARARLAGAVLVPGGDWRLVA